MKKNQKKNVIPAVAVSHDHPGRPRYQMQYPSTLTFTFTELMQVNGVDTNKFAKNGHVNRNFGKGDNCTMLTCRKNLKFAMASEVSVPDGTTVNKKPSVYLMKGYTAKPDSDGLGRRGLLYRVASTPFADALAEAKVRGAEGFEQPAPKAKVKAKAKAKVVRKSRKVAITADEKADVAKVIADAKAILAEPAATVQILPVAEPAIETPVNTTGTPPATATLPVIEISTPAPVVAEQVTDAAPVVPVEPAPVSA